MSFRLVEILYILTYFFIAEANVNESLIYLFLYIQDIQGDSVLRVRNLTVGMVH